MSDYIYFLRRLLRQATAFVVSVLICIAGIGLTYAKACPENAMLVFDASASMSGRHGGMSKMMAAQEAAIDVLPQITKYRPTGLVTYGGLFYSTCNDVHLKVPPTLNSADLILAELGLMKPNGPTPLSDAVLLAAKTLQGLRQAGIIVLITDGFENCGYDVCQVGRKLKTEAPDIRVHVIGFHLENKDEARISCLPQETNGTYASTNSLETLREALRQKLSCPQISKRPNTKFHPAWGRLAQFEGAITPKKTDSNRLP